jgi:RNA polymerase sigma-70 factor (ECF subfamily)
MARYDQDLSLVRELLSGDSIAFERFHRHYFQRLFRYVLPRVRNRYDVAQDVCQRTLVQGVNKLAGFRGEASLLTWLCQIAGNELKLQWERDRVAAGRFLQSDDDGAIRKAMEAVASPYKDRPEALRMQSEAVQWVHRILDELAPNYAEVLEWKYLDGLSVDEIALRSQQTTIAVQSLLARARGAFRDEFAKLTGVALLDLLMDGEDDAREQ